MRSVSSGLFRSHFIKGTHVIAESTSNPLTILRRKQVEARTGLSRSTIYERIRAGTFPSPVSLGAKAVGWVEDEISVWLAQLVSASRKPAERVELSLIGQAVPRGGRLTSKRAPGVSYGDSRIQQGAF